MKKIDKPTVIIIVVFVLFFAFISAMIHCGNQYTENEYQLDEIDDGVYAIYYTTHSRVPAENYDVVTVCCNNSIYTFNGDVKITYTEQEPYVYIKETNLVHGDEIHVYIPKGSVMYEKSVNIGR